MVFCYSIPMLSHSSDFHSRLHSHAGQPVVPSKFICQVEKKGGATGKPLLHCLSKHCKRPYWTNACRLSAVAGCWRSLGYAARCALHSGARRVQDEQLVLSRVLDLPKCFPGSSLPPPLCRPHSFFWASWLHFRPMLAYLGPLDLHF